MVDLFDLCPVFYWIGVIMGNLKIGSVVQIVDQEDAMNDQIGSVVYFDKEREKILVRFGGVQQLYYELDQLKEY